MIQKKQLIINIGQIVHCNPEYPDPVITDGYIEIFGDKIISLGEMSRCPNLPDAEIYDANGMVVTPGFIDCHTHLVFGGNRSKEFEMRAAGAEYEAILYAGGGINHTVIHTRNASEEELYQTAYHRLQHALRYGITTCEIKSGYGLDEKNELKMLNVIQKLKKSGLQRIYATYLGAHIVPKEYRENRGEYIDLMINTMLPEIAKKQLAESVDIFSESSAFTIEETEKILKAAQKNGFNLKLHGEQLSRSGATELGIKYNALSVDHLEFLDQKGFDTLATSNTVAVILPLATLGLNKENYPNGRKIIDAGGTVAIATDFNPGSAPSQNINLALTLGVLKCGLSPLEALKSVTINAAKALGLEQKIGSIEPGKQADFICHNVNDYRFLIYRMGESFVADCFINGISLGDQFIDPCKVNIL